MERGDDDDDDDAYPLTSLAKTRCRLGFEAFSALVEDAAPRIHGEETKVLLVEGGP
ncbi:hypothetical protein K0M31_000819 [Melipona bicolor]|uniref:Uncharacterized protein n=1 Tax=Melipona bicolor TaxID=60889 RepID=A0AA40GF72_9HYME|nr:hypothetical protein K0M31_000819 [Melipona bicolor]